ncbi:MAG: hypothetical protein PHO90_00945 [Candidatus Pacebacteria bacterium]|nr:hypothetical protein [Candidatus Paceibacterota bacterium]
MMKQQLKAKKAMELVGLEIVAVEDHGNSLVFTLSNGSILVAKSGCDIGIDERQYPVAVVELNGEPIWTD